MSQLARENGWRGFDNAGAVERVDGGHEYSCDGMPTMMGCPSRIVVTRKWARVGTKKSRWLVVYGCDEPEGAPDLDVVLVFCPSCAAVVRRQGYGRSRRPADTDTGRGQ